MSTTNTLRGHLEFESYVEAEWLGFYLVNSFCRFRVK